MGISVEVKNKREIAKKVKLYKELVNFNPETQICNIAIYGRVIMERTMSNYLTGEFITKVGAGWKVDVLYNDLLVSLKDNVTININHFNK